MTSHDVMVWVEQGRWCTHLEIALDGIINGGAVHVVLGHEHIHYNVPDSRLKVGLLSIH